MLAGRSRSRMPSNLAGLTQSTTGVNRLGAALRGGNSSTEASCYWGPGRRVETDPTRV